MNWKISFNADCKSTRRDTLFCIIPTIGITTSLFNHKTSYTIFAAWLFFIVNADIKYNPSTNTSNNSTQFSRK